VRLPGAEVVAFAGEALGAEVATAAGESPGASFQRDPVGAE
jgi:hypothetical protein